MNPVTWFSVGVGGLMNYLRYETNVEEIVRLTQEMEDVYIDISRELDTFRINLMRNTNTEVRFIVRRIEIAINLIRFGGGALLSEGFNIILKKNKKQTYYNFVII